MTARAILGPILSELVGDGGEKLKAIYAHLWSAHGGAGYEALDRSLGPRPPEMLYDFVGKLNLAAGSAALDVGCGKGNHACELARRFDFGVTGVDPVDDNLEIARASAAAQGLGGRVVFAKGSMEEIPSEDATFGLVWCRDMLVHVGDLPRGFRECSRVLKPGGFALVFTTYATGRMEPKESARLCDALGLVEDNLSRRYAERCFEGAGFTTLSREEVGSELMQFYEERDGRCSRELMRLARMLSAEERFVAELGETSYRVTSALYQWVVYQLIGKLSSYVYVLRSAGFR